MERQRREQNSAGRSLIQRRKANFFEQHSETWIVRPHRIHLCSCPDGIHSSVALLEGKLERGEPMILFTQARIDVGDSQPGNIFCFCFLDEFTEDSSGFRCLAGFGISVSQIATVIRRFRQGLNGFFHFRYSLIKPFLQDQDFSVEVVADWVIRVHIESLAELLFRFLKMLCMHQ